MLKDSDKEFSCDGKGTLGLSVLLNIAATPFCICNVTW